MMSKNREIDWEAVEAVLLQDYKCTQTKLSHHLGINLGTLNRKFKNKFNMSITDYLDKNRLLDWKKINQMIADNHSVKEIECSLDISTKDINRCTMIKLKMDFPEYVRRNRKPKFKNQEEIDWKKAGRLTYDHHKGADIARHLGIKTSLFYRYLNRKFNMSFEEYARERRSVCWERVQALALWDHSADDIARILKVNSNTLDRRAQTRFKMDFRTYVKKRECI